jgi:pimeloyl-ACP methyl ester carboxylesterase
MTTIDQMHRQSHRVSGAAGCELFVDETGNPDGQPILFIHGLSQCRLAWNRQLDSELRRDMRLVAMDLRGHGRSQRPRDAYGEPSLWADDIHAVITTLGLRRPILCGWSYGGVVIGDYVRRHGEAALGGIVLVGAVSMLGEAVLPFLGPEFIDVLPALFASDVEESNAGLQAFIRICASADPEPEEFFSILGYNSVVPPHVRQAMLSRTVSHDDLYARLETPILITHGLEDRVVLPAMSEQLARVVPNARTSFYPGIGHSPFRESTDRFNTDLHAFATSVA